jgi:UDP-N-acetylglucosamine 2-epimerase (non-hydrolysing)
LIVLGTRPEAVKLAPLVAVLRRRADRVRLRVCSTGQHREILEPALRLFDIVPDHQLQIMRPGQDLAEVTGRMLCGLAEVFRTERPDVVVVQGDTATAFAGALGAYYGGARVGHVEAGLRTGDKRFPFPEEVNRTFVSSVADLHFAPTVRARDHLLREGVDARTIHVTGNTVVDALETVRAAWKRGRIDGIGRARGLLHTLLAPPRRRLVLVTCHRRETWNEGLDGVCRALAELARSEPNLAILFPIHPNPVIRRQAEPILAGVANVHLVEPLDYEDFLYMLHRCELVLTDSGGVQEEAPSFGKPLLVMREATERPEGIEAGVALLVGTSPERIVAETRRLLHDADAYRSMVAAVNPYGNGRAAETIADILEECA